MNPTMEQVFGFLKPKAWELKPGDCLHVLAMMPDNSVDSVVCDPPYGISFMCAKWDYEVPSVAIWKEVLRVLKPGGYLLAFAGTRTQHRMAVNIEDAGFDIREIIAWMHGQGFPKSHNVALGIDKIFGHGDRGHRMAAANRCHPDGTVEPNGESLPAYEGKCEQSKPWAGWGNNLKPAMEPITMARKPCSESTIAANVLKHGTGAINIDGCRIALQEQGEDPRLGGKGTWGTGTMAKSCYGDFEGATVGSSTKGRFPANVILSHHPSCVETEETSEDPGYVINRFVDGAKPFGGGAGHDFTSEAQPGGKKNIWLCHPGCPMRFFPDSNGQMGDMKDQTETRKSPNGCFGTLSPAKGHKARDDGGVKSAARFFYCAKANKQDRAGSKHPTVKPIALMRYLCRLVTPPGGLVLDPFAGSGTTGQAAIEEGFRVVMIEREAQYQQDIINRMQTIPS